MKKIFFFLLLSLQLSFLTSHEYPSQLTDFLKCLFTDSESGYVFFGSKPVCYFGCSTSTDPFSFGTSTDELESKLRLGAEWWEEAQPTQSTDNFVLKIKRHGDLCEILSLNKKRILETVENNLSLFRYILGHKVTPENLFIALATSDDPFYQILNHNNTLVGILLGFGTENSILGARSEALLDFQLASPEIPYAKYVNHSPEKALNYLELSFLFKDNFKRTSEDRWQRRLGINSIEEEIQIIQNIQEPSRRLLSTYSPRFIFSSYQLQKNNDALLDTLEKEQQKIIELLHSNDFTYQVLKQLDIVFSNPSPNIQTEVISATVLAHALKNSSRLRLFDDLEGILEGIQDVDLGQKDRYIEPDLDLFYELLVLKELQKNFHATEEYFTTLKQDQTFTKVNEQVFMKNLYSGNRQPFEILQKNHSKVTLSYAAYLPLESELLPIKAASNISLNLNEVIQGLALGLQGMKTGELREIHFSPEAGYGFIADFQTSGPIKLLVRLENIEDSPPLVLSQPSAALERSILLSADEIDTLNQTRKALSYHLGKTFWQFFKVASSFSGDRLIEQLKILWNQPEQKIVNNSLDSATLAIFNKQHQQEKQRAQLAFKNSPRAIELEKDLLYVEYEKQGFGPTSWPKSISLLIKNLDGKILQESFLNNLNQNEFARLSKGLQVGISNARNGDKGNLLIDPDLGDQGLFRNKLSHQALLVEFEIEDK